jgi:hypothetical protein
MIENNLGKLIGVIPTVNTTTASGVFSLDQHYDQVAKNLWPKWSPTMYSLNPGLIGLTSESVNSSTISLPSGLNSSMFAVFFDFTWRLNNNILIPDVIPSGWTQVATASQTSVGTSRTSISWKKLTSADSSQVITGLNSTSGFSRKMIIVLKENSGIDRFTVNSNLVSLQARGGTSLPSGSTSFSSYTKPFIFWISYTGANDTPDSNRSWTGSSPNWESRSGYGNMYIKFFVVNSPDAIPTNGTYSVGSTTDIHSLGAGYFTLSG